MTRVRAPLCLPRRRPPRSALRAVRVGTLLSAASVVAVACAAPMAARGAGVGAPVVGPFESHRITITTRGAGPDVVLLAGLASSATDVWAGTVAAVPGHRYHLVQVHGFAGIPAGANADGGPVVGPVADEVARYIATLQPAPASTAASSSMPAPAVIGHSMGGAVALALAVRHPEAVSRLMIVDMIPWMGAFFGPPGSVTPVRAQAIAERMRTEWAAPGEEPWRRRITASVTSMIRTDSLHARAIANGVASDRAVAAQVMHDMVLQDLRAELARVDIPIRVLYVQGPHLPLDTAQVDAAFRAAYAAAPHATLARIPDAFHFLMLDQPARFADEVRRFLAP